MKILEYPLEWKSLQEKEMFQGTTILDIRIRPPSLNALAAANDISDIIAAEGTPIIFAMHHPENENITITRKFVMVHAKEDFDTRRLRFLKVLTTMSGRNIFVFEREAL